jgi:hypothetical protein
LAKQATLGFLDSPAHHTRDLNGVRPQPGTVPEVHNPALLERVTGLRLLSGNGVWIGRRNGVWSDCSHLEAERRDSVFRLPDRYSIEIGYIDHRHLPRIDRQVYTASRLYIGVWGRILVHDHVLCDVRVVATNLTLNREGSILNELLRLLEGAIFHMGHTNGDPVARVRRHDGSIDQKIHSDAEEQEAPESSPEIRVPEKGVEPVESRFGCAEEFHYWRSMWGAVKTDVRMALSITRKTARSDASAE